MAAIRNSNYYEMALVHPKVPWTRDLYVAAGYRDGLDAVDENGCVEVPTGPGLGVEWDWDYIRANERGMLVYD